MEGINAVLQDRHPITRSMSALVVGGSSKQGWFKVRLKKVLDAGDIRGVNEQYELGVTPAEPEPQAKEQELSVVGMHRVPDFIILEEGKDGANWALIAPNLHCYVTKESDGVLDANSCSVVNDGGKMRMGGVLGKLQGDADVGMVKTSTAQVWLPPLE